MRMLLSLIVMLLFASCGKGQWGCVNNCTETRVAAHLTVDAFMAALNRVDYVAEDSVVLKNINETERSKLAGEGKWFIIWDAKYSQYKAVNLDYLKNVVGYEYDVYRKGPAYGATVESSVAENFRGFNDINYGYGVGYEAAYSNGDGTYTGHSSGYIYEDEAETTDVSLMAKEKEETAMYEKASKISYLFNINIQSSMSMAILGDRIQKMMSRNSGELTAEDKSAIMSEFDKTLGVSAEEMMRALENQSGQKALVEKIAEKIGTNSENLEQRIFPEIFGFYL